MIVVGGVLTCLAGIMHFIIMIDDVLRDEWSRYVALGLMGGFLILAGIFIAVSYRTKTYMQGFQEALRAVNKSVSNDLVSMQEKIDKLEKKLFIK